MMKDLSQAAALFLTAPPSFGIEMSVSADAIDWAASIHGRSRTNGFARDGSSNRPRRQHDAGPYNAAGGITDVLAVDDSFCFLRADSYKS
jgi:hypothetical protein